MGCLLKFIVRLKEELGNGIGSQKLINKSGHETLRLRKKPCQSFHDYSLYLPQLCFRILFLRKEQDEQVLVPAWNTVIPDSNLLTLQVKVPKVPGTQQSSLLE